MEERGRFAGGHFELVEHSRELGTRCRNRISRRKQMAGVESIAGARPIRRRDSGQHGAHFFRGTPHCRAGTGRVLDEQPGAAGRNRRQRATHRLRHAGDGRLAVAIGGRTGVKAHASHTERRGALKLLGERGGGTIPLLVVGRGAVDHVRGMHDDVLGADAGLGQCFLISGESLRLHPDFVIVELGDRAENLQCLHAGLARTTRGHGDATAIDAVRAKEKRHTISSLVGGELCA